MKKSVLLCMLMFGLSLQFVKANGLSVTNISLQGQNITNQTWQVQFNITWNNSWRDGINYDAAWIFVKYRIQTGPWTHAILNTSGFNTGSGTSNEIRITPDGVGAMVNRDVVSDGTFSVTGMQLQWNYGSNNVQNTDLPQVRVFAIEMVQIPAGPFAIGDGDGGSESFTALGIADNRWYMVTTDLSPPLRADGNFSNGNNILRIDGDGGVDNDADGIIDNTNYPVGYNAFFMMKYKITLEQYADFLTLLLPLQAAPRYQGNQSNRFNINASGGMYFTNFPDRACNFLSWTDGTAYADWAGLRPFSETEFEKACRGPLAPVLNEFAWGTTSFSPSYSGQSNAQNSHTRMHITIPEDGTETVVNSNANAWWPSRMTDGTTTSTTGGSYIAANHFNHVYDQNGDGYLLMSNTANHGPMRVGLVVKSSGATRQNGGLSYYGVVDLSSNLSEQMYNITTSTGRQFTQIHGNGSLTANGIHNVSGWPSSGFGLKGRFDVVNSNGTDGYNSNLHTFHQVSNRSNIENSSASTSRYSYVGYRCARTQWW